MAVIHITLFGAPRIARDGAAVMAERRKSLALLAYLTAMPGAHGRATLATLLWPDLDESAARGSLRHALLDLRQAIGAEWVETEGDRVALRSGPGLHVDVGRFHELLTQVAAHRHPAQRLCDACLASLTEATNLYTADFLAGFTLADAGEFDAWQTFQTESLRLELAGALEKLATGLAGRQEYAAALPHARRWLALDPLHEPAHRLLMQLHAGAGDRPAALRQYAECVKVLHDELGIVPEPETTALFAAIRGGAAGLPSTPLPLDSPAPAHNLPADPTPFIGREVELAQIVARLTDPACRLLTILGPGGMGKTRLAIQAARGAAEGYAHGAWFVDLAPLASAEQLAETILRALQAPVQGATEPDQSVLRHLADKQMLLVLDNYEQLLRGQGAGERSQESGDRGQGAGDGAGLLVEILRAAPRVKLLVTSRARLNVRAEWLAPLAGLALPGDLEREAPEHEDAKEHEAREARRSRSDARESSRSAFFASLRDFAFQTPTDLEHYDATALFLACVRRVQPDFRPTADDARRIVRICRLLAGMPLAIELAAAWIRALPLAQIEAELEHGLNLLTTTMRDVPPRHRSMAAAFDHSWRLLSAAERRILRQLSVFRGGFTREAAHEVTCATTADLAGLTDASWLRVGPTGRYAIHELTRQYCAEKLEAEHESETGETPDQVRDRYAGYFQAFAQSTRGGWGRPLTMVEQLAPEIDNLLAAREWHVTRVNTDAALEITRMFAWYGYRLGWYASMFPSLERSIRQLEGQAATAAAWDDPRRREHAFLLGALHHSLADCHLMMGSGDRAFPHLQQAEVYLAQGPLDDPRWRETHWLYRRTLAFAKEFQGEFAESMHLWETLRSELSDPLLQLYPYNMNRKVRSRAEICWGEASDAWRLGQYALAQSLCEESLSASEQCGWEWGQGPARRILAWVYLATGAYREAEAQARAALNSIRAAGDRSFIADFYIVLGMMHCAQGNYNLADACHRRGLTLAKSLSLYNSIGHALRGLAAIALAQGRSAAARQLYVQSLDAFEYVGTSWQMGPAFVQIGLGQVALVMHDLPEARRRFGRVFVQGHCAAHQLAQGIAGMVEVRLGAGGLASAVELLAFLQAWPPTPFAVRERAAALLAELEAELPAEEFVTACGRGRARKVEEVVAELAGPCAAPAPVAEADRLSR
jgi:predicted ATPase/DNA-binding SARP family transcriptional activator